MTTLRFAALSAVVLAVGAIGCSKPANTSTTTTTQTAGPVAAGNAGVTPAPVTTTPATNLDAGANAALPPVANGYSCSFPGPSGHSILARFTLDGGGAHDDQGLPFTVLTSSPTALVLAHARDDAATAPDGDIGAYVVAIDRRSLGMVQTTIGLDGQGSTRRGHCIAG